LRTWLAGFVAETGPAGSVCPKCPRSEFDGDPIEIHGRRIRLHGIDARKPPVGTGGCSSPPSRGYSRRTRAPDLTEMLDGGSLGGLSGLTRRKPPQ